MGLQANWPYYCCENVDSGNMSDRTANVHSTIVDSMLGQQRKRWPNIETALGQLLLN